MQAKKNEKKIAEQWHQQKKQMKEMKIEKK